MDKELKGIDKHLKNLRIPEADNKAHEKALRSLLSTEIERTRKRRNIFALSIVKYALPVAAVLILVFGLWFFVLRDFLWPESTVNIVSVQGTVYERTALDKENRSVLKQGEYKKGTVLSTEKDNTITFSMGKNTQVKLLELSQIELRTLGYSDTVENSSLFLSNGKIECSVEMPGTDSLFEVLTDYTRIRVYGTKFSVQVLDNKDVLIQVKEGIVKIDNFYRAEENVASIKDTVPTIDKELGELLDNAIITINKQQELRIDYKEIATRNTKLEDFLDQIWAVHLSPYAEEGEKKLGFRGIIYGIKAVVDPNEFIEQDLRDSAEIESEAEPDVEQPESTTESGAPVAKNETSLQIEETERKPQRILYLPTNAGVEQGLGIPSGWYKSENTNIFSWTDEVAHTGNKSIKIASADKRDRECAWAYTLTTDLPFGKQFTLKAFVKTEEIKGQGVCLTLRADDTTTASGKAEMYVTTQGKRVIKGSRDWTEYTINFATPLAYEINSITIYLIYLPNTKGSVSFVSAVRDLLYNPHLT